MLSLEVVVMSRRCLICLEDKDRAEDSEMVEGAADGAVVGKVGWGDGVGWGWGLIGGV